MKVPWLGRILGYRFWAQPHEREEDQLSLSLALQSAIVAGAIAGVQPTATQAVKDAYAGLKTLLIDLYAGFKGSFGMLEAAPEDERAAAAVGHDIAKSKAAEDQAVQSALGALQELLQAQQPELLHSVEVRIKNFDVGGNLEVAGPQVRVEGEEWRTEGNASFTAYKKKA